MANTLLCTLDLQRSASRKPGQLNAAIEINDLDRPCNHLKPLKGKQWSIRINDWWMLCFRWPEGGLAPEDVEIAATALGYAIAG